MIIRKFTTINIVVDLCMVALTDVFVFPESANRSNITKPNTLISRSKQTPILTRIRVVPNFDRGGKLLIVTVSRADLKAYFAEIEKKPFMPSDCHLPDETCLLPILPFLRAIWLSALDVSDNPTSCSDV